MKIPYILLATMMFFPVACQDIQESIKLIDIHISYLHSLYQNHHEPKKNVFSQDSGCKCSSSYGNFQNPVIVACISDIQKHENLDPFFALWKVIKKNSFADEALLEEYALLSIIFFNNILDELSYSRVYCDNDEIELTVDEIVELYDRLAAMPLVELVNLLNGIVNCVIAVIQHTSINKVLFSWLQAPWWEPVFMITAYIVKWLIY